MSSAIDEQHILSDLFSLLLNVVISVCVFLLYTFRWSTALDVSARGMHSQCIQRKATICDGYKIERFTI